MWIICPTSDKSVKVKHLRSKMTHKPIVLRLWVRVCCLSCLRDCSSLDVDSPLTPPMTQQKQITLKKKGLFSIIPRIILDKSNIEAHTIVQLWKRIVLFRHEIDMYQPNAPPIWFVFHQNLEKITIKKMQMYSYVYTIKIVHLHNISQ